MLKELIDIVKSFFTTIGKLIDFIFGMIEDLIYVIKLLGEVTVELPNFFSWLPPEILAIILSIVAIIVIYKVIGREG